MVLAEVEEPVDDLDDELGRFGLDTHGSGLRAAGHELVIDAEGFVLLLGEPDLPAVELDVVGAVGLLEERMGEPRHRRTLQKNPR